MPLFFVSTILTALFTILLTPLSNFRISNLPGRMWGRTICALFFIRVRIKGLENIQNGQSYIFAANHQSMFDIYVLYGWLPVLFKWVMKAPLRKIPLVGYACQKAGHIFIDQTSRSSAKHMLEDARRQLTNGISVIIFPEGTRTRDGRINRFKRGAFTLATELELPVLPVTIDGAFDCQRRGSAFIRPGTICITVHRPICPTAHDKSDTKRLSEQCQSAIQSAL